VAGLANEYGAHLMTSLTILMPVFNERETVETAIQRTLEAEMGVDDRELIVIDDGSTDGTTEILQQDWSDSVQLVCHARNLGKGAAIQTGLRHASGRFTTVMDADLEYDPAEVDQLVAPLMDGDADAVFGVRGFQAHNAYSFWYVIGNRGVTFAANLLYNCWLADLMTCHKAIQTELFRSLSLRESGFAIEAEITARLVRRGVRIFEVPVTYHARGRNEGKKLEAMDGVRTLRTLIRCRFDSAGRIDNGAAEASTRAQSPNSSTG
jgi:glycosyltransferase involved in cell wall biosynthesis